MADPCDPIRDEEMTPPEPNVRTAAAVLVRIGLRLVEKNSPEGKQHRADSGVRKSLD